MNVRIIQAIAQKLINYFCVCACVVCNLSGKPFIHPDGSAVVYGPTTVSSAAARNPQQGKNPQQPIPGLTQQQPSSHFHSQVSWLELHRKPFLIICRNLPCLVGRSLTDCLLKQISKIYCNLDLVNINSRS